MVKLIPGTQRIAIHAKGDLPRPHEPVSWSGYKNACFVSCCETSAVHLLLQKKYWRCNHLLQNPGNIVPPYGTPGAEAAEIERAFRGGVRDFVVCGHHPCSVVRSLVFPEADPPPGPAMVTWLSQATETGRVVAASYADLDRQAKLEAAVQVHVLAQIQNLMTYPFLADEFEDGTLYFHAWVANTALGQIFHFNPVEGQFEPWLRTAAKSS